MLDFTFMQFSTKIDGFQQKDSQDFENSYNSYEQYPLEKYFIFTIYQNYTLALNCNPLINQLTPTFSLMTLTLTRRNQTIWNCNAHS